MKKPFSLSPLIPKEQVVLNAVLDYLNIDRRVAWVRRFNTGAVLIEGTHGRRDRFVRFAFPGCPDLLGQLVDGRLLAVEIKREGGRLRPNQREFLATVTHHHGLAVVARSIDDMIQALDATLPRITPAYHVETNNQ